MEKENNFPVWPGWETVRLIGHGSFGSVYEIERDVFGEKEKAALKVISIPKDNAEIDELRISDGYDDESLTAEFTDRMNELGKEYSLMRKLNGNTNVVNCDDMRCIHQENGFGWDIFIRMEYLTPLKAALGSSISDSTVIKIGADMCRALCLCERNDIIHRDIKPENIFISKLGDYKLGDFGVSRTLERTTGATMTGTYTFMAPEVYNHMPYNHQSDIYSLGLVLYWLLNEKRTPFLPLPPKVAKTAEKEMAQNRRFSGERIPAPKNGSAELKRIVLKACEFDVDKRYYSADEMLADLEELSGGKPARTVYSAPAHVTEPVEDDSATVGAWSERAKTEPTKDAPIRDDGEETVGAWSTPKTEPSAKNGMPEDDGDKTVGAWHEPVAHTIVEKPQKADNGSENTAPQSKPETTVSAEPPTEPKPGKISPAPKKSKKRPIIIGAAAAVAIIVAVGLSGLIRNSIPKSPASTPAPAIASKAPAAEAPVAEAPVETKHLSCATTVNEYHPEFNTLLWIASQFNDATNGRYFIEVYPSEQLGDQYSTLEAVMTGGLDMTIVSSDVISTYSPYFTLFGYPYVFDSLEHQVRVFGSDALDALFSETEPLGFSVLSGYTLFPRNIYSTMPVSTPNDLAGKSIRVVGKETNVRMMNCMTGGTDGVAMAQGDVYSAIQMGVIDGAENSIVTYVDLVQYEVARYYNLTNHTMIPDMLCISNDVLNEMSAEDQQILRDICREAVEYMYESVLVLQEDYYAKARELGVEIVESDVKAFQKLCEPITMEAVGISDVTIETYNAIKSYR